MKLVINAKEVKAADRIFDAAFVSRELDIPSHYIKEFIEGRNFLGQTRDQWVENQGVRYFYTKDGELTLELNSNNVAVMHHIADNFDRYARVVNGVMAVAKAFKFAISAFKSEVKKLERFTMTLNQNSKEYDYQPFSEEAFAASLVGLETPELEDRLERHGKALRDADNKKEFDILMAKVQLLKEARVASWAAKIDAEAAASAAPVSMVAAGIADQKLAGVGGSEQEANQEQ